METPAHSESVIPQEAGFKNRLQEYTQKVGIPYPMYNTENKVEENGPKFRSKVVINGVAYESPNFFSHRKSAEMDAARIALQNLVPQIPEENCSLGQDSLLKDAFICKSILNEYAMKTNAGTPIYNIETEIVDGLSPTFVSSVKIDGKQYVGDKGRKKKESQHLAARAAILSLLDSDACTVVSKIINSRKRLSAAKEKAKYSCKPEASVVEGLEANGSSTISVPLNLEQLMEQLIDSKSAKKRKRRSMKAENKAGIDAQVQIAAVQSSVVVNDSVHRTTISESSTGNHTSV